jgi:hypothetical protein
MRIRADSAARAVVVIVGVPYIIYQFYSKRLGHSKPDITLRICAHLFRKDDGKAAAAINAALGGP